MAECSKSWINPMHDPIVPGVGQKIPKLLHQEELDIYGISKDKNLSRNLTQSVIPVYNFPNLFCLIIHYP